MASGRRSIVQELVSHASPKHLEREVRSASRQTVHTFFQHDPSCNSLLEPESVLCAEEIDKLRETQAYNSGSHIFSASATTSQFTTPAAQIIRPSSTVPVRAQTKNVLPLSQKADYITICDITWFLIYIVRVCHTQYPFPAKSHARYPYPKSLCYAYVLS
jgi:hypothetical protein